jgi:hypothetical protein
VGRPWRAGWSTHATSRRQCDLFRNRQAHPFDSFSQSRFELGLIAHQSRMTFPRIAIPFKPCRPLRRKRYQAFANRVQLLRGRRAPIDRRIEDRGQPNGAATARTQHRKAQQAVDRGRLIEPAKRNVWGHVGVMLSHRPKGTSLRRIGHNLAHADALKNDHIRVQCLDCLDVGAARRAATFRVQHLPTKQSEYFPRACARAPD